MYKKKVSYEDYDGNQREEELMFNMNKAEVYQWLLCNGGYTLDKLLLKLQGEGRGKDIMDIFDDLILRSYGKKSVDGRRFDKTPEIVADFKATEAYSIVFTELVTDAKKAAEFINGIFPKDLRNDISKILEENPEGIPDEVKDYLLSENSNKVVPMKPEA